MATREESRVDSIRALCWFARFLDCGTSPRNAGWTDKSAHEDLYPQHFKPAGFWAAICRGEERHTDTEQCDHGMGGQDGEAVDIQFSWTDPGPYRVEWVSSYRG